VLIFGRTVQHQHLLEWNGRWLLKERRARFAYADIVATCTDAITAEAHALRAHESAAWCPFEDLGPAAAGQQGCG
jgi:hypothetical protein